MKKVFVIFILIFCAVDVIAVDYIENDKNAVFLNLDDNTKDKDLLKGVIESSKFNSVDVKSSDNTAGFNKKQKEILLYEDVNRIQPEKKSVSKSIEKEVIKDTSFGATYSTSEKSGKMDDSVSVYSKYKKNKFALTTEYKQNREGFKENGADQGSFSISPEISLNDHVKLKNTYSDNIYSNQKKSEMVLSLRPFKDDRIDFDLGAGETFSNGNESAKSQINIGTKFRF